MNEAKCIACESVRPMSELRGETDSEMIAPWAPETEVFQCIDELACIARSNQAEMQADLATIYGHTMLCNELRTGDGDCFCNVADPNER